MFKNYSCITQKQKQIQLIDLGYGYQGVILTIEIFGGQSDGVLTINKYDNNSLIFTQDLNIGRKQPVALTHKILIPQNHKLKIYSNIDGIRVCANVVFESEQQYFNNEQSSTSSKSSSSL